MDRLTCGAEAAAAADATAAILEASMTAIMPASFFIVGMPAIMPAIEE